MNTTRIGVKTLTKVVATGALAAAAACGGADPLPVGTGGVPGGGATGGIMGTGGFVGSGGSISMGGRPSACGTGGAVSTGGARGGAGGGGTGGTPTGGIGGLGSGGTPTGGAGGTPTGGTGGTLARRKLDLLFMIDNSSSMAPLQKALTKSLPSLIDALSSPANGGLPDIHLGVASSDLGAARSIVPGCARIGGDQGMLQNTGKNPPGCTGPRDKFIIDSINADGTRSANFSGSLSDTLACIAPLGQSGCGFESQFGSVLAALSEPPPTGNEGFLRDDAVLGVVMFTNEDDCTAPPDSDLFNPNMSDPAHDPYGALQSYRCTEFGIVCDQPLPHLAPATPVTLTNCHSKEDGRLLRVRDFVSTLRQAKVEPHDLFFAAVAANPAMGDASSVTISATTVGGVAAPMLNHAPGCESYAGDNGIRIREAASLLGGTVSTICQDDYTEALQGIARALNERLVP